MDDISQKLPETHPMLKAWEIFKGCAEYQSAYSSVREGAGDLEIQGALWAAFCAGYQLSEPNPVA